MSKYQRGKIYKIIDNITGKVYFGSTIEPKLARRLNGHIATFKSYKQGKGSYVSSFEIFENNDYVIVLVELFPCDSKDELFMRERFYIENNECVNKKRPILTIQETEHYNQDYYNEHKEELLQYQQEYYKENKEQILTYQKDYSQTHKEQVKQYKIKYSQKEDSKIKKQQYRDTHKEQSNKKMLCECGITIIARSINKHRQTKKHNELMNSKE